MTMQISYIANVRLPTERAHGAQIMHMCKAFADAGVIITLVIPRRINALIKSPYEYYDILPSQNFRIIKLPVIDLVPWKVPGAFMIESITFVLSSAWYICRTKPAVVYTRGESVLLLARMLPKSTTLFWETHAKQKNIESYKRIFPKIRGFITLTKLYAKELTGSYNVPAEQVLTAHDGIDARFLDVYSKADARRELGLPKKTKIVMYFGLLDEWKGVDTLFKSSGQLLMQGIRIAIAGGSEAEVSRLKQQYPDVIFLGFTEYRRLPRLQVAADILVVPNSAKSLISTHYTSPLKVFAHMASGVPLIASDLPSLHEVLNEKNAYFFKADESASLIQGIQEILADTNAGQTRATKAKLDAKEYFWSTRAERIISFIASLT